MSRSRRPPPAVSRQEQLIAALLPDSHGRQPPRSPARLPTLPAPNLAALTATDRLLVGMARIDRSGRLHERTLLRALGWEPNRHLHLDIARGLIVVTPDPTGRHVLDSRSALPLPAAARRMCGITPGPPVVLIAAIAEQLLVIHPAAVVARLLAAHYTTIVGADHER